MSFGSCSTDDNCVKEKNMHRTEDSNRMLSKLLLNRIGLNLFQAIEINRSKRFFVLQEIEFPIDKIERHSNAIE